jgi:cyclopropane-fatty-acyl-phospholipid synthase
MSWLENAGLRTLGRIARTGELSVTLPDGTHRRLGNGAPAAELRIGDYSALRDIVRTGLTGFAEAYMDGRVDTPNLSELMRWGVANQKAWFEHPLSTATLPVRRLWQRVRPERRHPKVTSMNDHYNLGNDFYAAWLDETMTYSSARFQSVEQTLAEAQRNKYRAMADLVGLESGMRVLEIGCGWGGFAEYAAERGCEVTGITLSNEQADYARRRIAARGLANRVEIEIQDFREVREQYDAVVSIEMIESVDETHWSPLFATIERSLRPGARAAMQIITIQDEEWERYRSRADFIQQYIFPGGQLPAPKVLRRLAGTARLDVEKVDTFGLDYARTLAAWRERFESAWPRLAAEHGLDDRFRRMWELYLELCEAGFRLGRINVEQWAFVRQPFEEDSSASVS